MIFGRKKRPAQSDDHRLADETVSFEEDDLGDDIIDLEDVLEAPEDHATSNEMFGESTDRFDVEFAAGLKEPDAGDQRPVEFMDDKQFTEEELLFDDHQADDLNLMEEDSRTVVELDALGGDAAAVDDRYNLQEILQAGSTDQLMAELMAAETAALSEDRDALLEELLNADREELFTEQEVRGVAFEQKNLQELAELDVFATDSAMIEAIYEEETLLQEQIGGPPVEEGSFVEETLPISSADLDLRDLSGMGEVLEAAQGEGAGEALGLEAMPPLIAAGPVVAGLSAPAAVGSEQVESREELAGLLKIALPPAEEIFTIKAMTSGYGVAVSLEEEIILGFKPEQRLTVSPESTPAVQQPEFQEPEPGDSSGKTDFAEVDRMLEGSDLTLDTFMAVSDRDAGSEPGEGSLIELMARMEERLMSNIQEVLESKMHDIVHSVITEELENLRQSCQQTAQCPDGRG
jgi:hypothetical protein